MSYEHIVELCDQYLRGEMTTEQYLTKVERYVRDIVDKEVARKKPSLRGMASKKPSPQRTPRQHAHPPEVFWEICGIAVVLLAFLGGLALITLAGG